MKYYTTMKEKNESNLWITEHENQAGAHSQARGTKRYDEFNGYLSASKPAPACPPHFSRKTYLLPPLRSIP